VVASWVIEVAAEREADESEQKAIIVGVEPSEFKTLHPERVTCGNSTGCVSSSGDSDVVVDDLGDEFELVLALYGPKDR
jgi:hypothetical protein